MRHMGHEFRSFTKLPENGIKWTINGTQRILEFKRIKRLKNEANESSGNLPGIR